MLKPELPKASSSEWPAQRLWLQERIADCHVLLEQEQDEPSTNRLRGQIAAYRSILSEVDNVVPVAAHAVDYRQ